jgi:hypothetical protein
VGRDLLEQLLKLVAAGAGVEQALDEHPQALRWVAPTLA